MRQKAQALQYNIHYIPQQKLFTHTVTLSVNYHITRAVPHSSLREVIKLAIHLKINAYFNQCVLSSAPIGEVAYVLAQYRPQFTACFSLLIATTRGNPLLR